METRDEMVERLNALDIQIRAARKELFAFDYQKNLEKKSKFVGKYYKESGLNQKEHINCKFVYSIDKENLRLNTLRVSYWTDNDTYFGIEYDSVFMLNDDGEDERDYIEITKEEFENHLTQVGNKINLAVQQKTLPR